LTKTQIINANKTKVFADSCKVQKERVLRTLDKCIDLAVKKDGEIEALRHSNELCEAEALAAKENQTRAEREAKKQKFLRKMNGVGIYVEAAIIVGLGIYIVLSK
jgi:hypothetical protein